MKIYYDEANKSWWHEQTGLQLTFGVNKAAIPFQHGKVTSDVISFDVEVFQNHEVVTIGILTTQNSKNEFGIGGNLSLFRSLHVYLLKHGIFSFIFTTEDVLNQTNCGYIYCSQL